MDMSVFRVPLPPDIQLLPETYVILIYAFVNLPGGPDVEQTKALLESMVSDCSQLTRAV